MCIDIDTWTWIKYNPPEILFITVLLNLLFFTALNLIFSHPYIVNYATDQLVPLGVTEHLPGGHTLLVAEGQPRRLATHDAAVGEGVVAQQRLGSGPAS